MIQNKDIVCFSQINYWNEVPYPIHHMMRAIGHYNRILWVNPISVAFPSAKKRSFLRKITKRLQSHIRGFVRVHPKFYVFSPVTIPCFTKEAFYKINDKLLLLELNLILRFMQIEHPYVFVALPTFANVALSVPAERVIYYVSDKYSGYEHVTNRKNREIIEKLNQLLIRESDYVLFTARKFFDEVSEGISQKSFFLPHGVDLEFFQSKVKKHTPAPQDLLDINKPIIGYFGSLLKERSNMEIIRWCAERRPDWSFVFIGRKSDKFPEVEKLENVHFLGPKSHNEIPLYGKHFDICIISRYLNEAVRYSNPTKVNEFLALGKPIVSVPIDHLIREYPGLVSIASNGEEFLQQIEFEIKNDSREKARKRLEKVRSYSYERIGEYISALFENNPERARGFFR